MTTSNSSNKSGPTTLADRALKAWHEGGMIFIRFASGHEVSFPTKGNPRLESAAEEDVGRIEISPFGLHWPTLDEDLSFEGILAQVTHLGINFGVFGWLVERKSLSDKGRSSQMPCSEDLGLEFSLAES